MTGMGHAAAGVVAAYLIQRAAHQPFHLGIAGLSARISWLPDIDLVWGWWRRRRSGGQGHNPHHALWTHTPDGIMGLWPWRRRQYALFPRPLHREGARGTAFYRIYYRQPLFVAVEVLLTAAAVAILARAL